MNLFAGKEWRHRCRERLVDLVGEGEGGMNRKNSIDIYTLSCVKQIAGGKLLYKIGRVWWGDEREAQQGGATYVIMADSHCCMSETNTTL